MIPPFNVRVFAPNDKAPLVRVSVPAIVLLNEAGKETPFELLIVRLFGPLVDGNSTDDGVCKAVPLYCRKDELPKEGDVPVAVAVPSIDRIPFTFAPVVVFAPEPESVRLLYAILPREEEDKIVCTADPLYAIVPEPGVKVPRITVVNEPPMFRTPPLVILSEPELPTTNHCPNVTSPLTVSCEPELKVSVPVPLNAVPICTL